MAVLVELYLEPRTSICRDLVALDGALEEQVMPAAQVMLDKILADPALQSALVPYGYDLARILG